MHEVFCSSITLRKDKTKNSEYYWCIWRKKSTKKATNEEEKSALSPWECTVSQVDCNDGKTTWIALQISSAPTLLSRFGSQQPQKNAQGKEIWLQRRSGIGNWRVFLGQRQIVLQKKHQIVRDALESVYHPRRRLCWWIKSNFA